MHDGPHPVSAEFVLQEFGMVLDTGDVEFDVDVVDENDGKV